MNIEKLTDNLLKLGYEVKVFENQEDATDYLCKTNINTSIGFGGSMTVKEMNLYEQLSKHNDVYWHWESKDKDIYQKAINSRVYISSVNGVSENGELINIDGTCNRISSCFYGHEKVILIFGTNKIRENFEKALDRARNIAAVKNAIRLNKNTPCTKGNKCFDCNAPDRICKGLSVLWRKPSNGIYEIIIIKQELGY